MEKKITTVDFMTVAEKKIAEKKAERVDFINRMLSVMENGKEYRCKEIASLLQKQGIKRGTSIQNIAKSMGILLEMGWVAKTIRDGEPRTFEDWVRDEIIVNGKKYYSEEYHLGKRTVIPKITYYSFT